MRSRWLWLALGGALGLGAAAAVLHLGTALFLHELRFPFGAPAQRLETLETCPPHVMKWRANICSDPKVDARAEFTGVQFASGAFTLRAWWVPATHPQSPVVVYAPGAGQDRREGLRYTRAVLDAGWSMLMVDLRNHGQSDNDGTGVHYGTQEWADVLAAARFARLEYGAPRVACMGISMGAVSCIYAAARDPEHLVDAVVAEAPFASLPAVVLHQAEQRHLPRLAALAVTDALQETLGHPTWSLTPAAAAAAMAPRPFLHLVDGQDSLVEPWQSNLIFEWARAPKTRVDIPAARHGQASNTDPATVSAAVQAFLRAAAAAR